jgi:16S rRNA (adenine1518-N6/adenine1519-N6)-dimethyltransferase
MARIGAHSPRRRFAQHFLDDGGVVERIILAIAPRTDDRIVEIGPGTGALTRALLDRSAEVHVVEIDRDLARELPARLDYPGGLHVHTADALRFDFTALAPSPASLRIVGNLPYNISTPLLFRLFAQREAISDMHFMLQEEVVDRITASPGGKDYGRLTVMTRLYCMPERLFGVAPGSFVPPPKVESAMLRLVMRPAAGLAPYDEAAFQEVVLRAFSMRRKTLKNALRGLLGEARIRAAGVDPSVRPETLDLVAFIRLSTQLSG